MAEPAYDQEDQEEQTNSVADPISKLASALTDLNQEDLDKMGAKLLEQVKADITSRSEWLDRVEKHVKLTTQVFEEKTYPWPGASNIKYPLVSVASIQFHARAFPALLGNASIIKGKVIGKDPMGNKANRATRVSTYMNYQILNPESEWMDDMDRLLLILPIIGAAYKKTYTDPTTGKLSSEMIHPRDFIINYDAKDFVNARKTHRIWKTPNEIIELQNRGLYREFEDGNTFSPTKQASEARDATQNLNKSDDDSDYALQELFEVHCLWDLDGDGYKEPYIVTIREEDGKVYKVSPGYYSDKIEANAEKIIAIKQKQFFTAYFFLPDPESKVHGLGFGTMVGPINEAVNTIINQLTDNGTLNNLGGGFLSRGIRAKGGKIKFAPGEWKTINASGDDLRKGIFAMPTKDPSSVLFQLLGLLIDSGKDLSSVQDLMTGKNPGQNQPYSTSRMVMEQGLQVFNGIYKRIYRAMSREFTLMFKLNNRRLDLQHYADVLDEGGMEVDAAVNQEGQEKVLQFLAQDFREDNFDVMPTAEPDMIAEAQRILKAESLLQKMAAGLVINRLEATKRILEAEQHENIEALMNVPPPEPDPEIVLKEKAQKLDGLRLQLDVLVGQAEAELNEAKAAALKVDAEAGNVDKIHQQFIKEREADNKDFEALTRRLKVLADAEQNRDSGKEASGETGTTE